MLFSFFYNTILSLLIHAGIMVSIRWYTPILELTARKTWKKLLFFDSS